jgi:regulator of sigma E protease
MIGGLKDNDIILEIDGNKVESIMDVSKYITTSTGDVIDFKVERFDQEYLLKIKPNIVLSDDNLGNKVNKRMVGIKLGAVNNEINHVKLGPAQALIQSVKEVYFVSTSSLKYIGTMLTGSGDSSQLGGPYSNC